MAELKKGDIKDINGLLRQLNPDARGVTTNALRRLIKEPSVKIIVFRSRENNHIIGMASLHVIRTLSGLKGIVENVVVDEKHRGEGVGKRLMNSLIDYAKNRGVERLELTSKSEQQAANQFYKYLGFKKRETNVYLLELNELKESG